MKKTLLLLSLVVVALVASFYVAHKPAGESATPVKQNSPEKPLTPLEALTLVSQLPTQDVTQASADYVSCKENAPGPGFADLLPPLSKRLADAATNHGTPDEIADAGILLYDDGYTELAHPLLVLAEQKLPADYPNGRDAKPGDTAVPKVYQPNQKYTEVVKRLGWQTWSLPEEAAQWKRYAVAGWQQLSDYYRIEAPEKQRISGYFSPATIKQLGQLCIAPATAYTELKAQDYALVAREAWLRFRQAQGPGKVDRANGKRSFSQKAMLREQEDFDEIWIHQANKPFMLYIETPFNADLNQPRVDEVVKLLRQLHGWFAEQFITPMGLTRHPPEQDGQPFEVVLFASRYQFDRYVKDALAVDTSAPSIMYSYPEGRIVACLPRSDEQPTYPRSVVEAGFRLLCDRYGLSPSASTNALVANGLPDCVATFTQTDAGAADFMQLNETALAKFRNVRKQLEGRLLLRLRDLLRIRDASQVGDIAAARAQELEVNEAWARQNSAGLVTPTASLAVYFLNNYQRDGEYVYRDALWQFLQDEYTGLHKLTGTEDDVAIEAFRKTFGIETEVAWDQLEQEFADYTAALGPDGEAQEPPDGHD